MSFSTIGTFNSIINYGSILYLFPSLDPYLVLYYPFDSSMNINGSLKTPNFAKQSASYDATLVGNAKITSLSNAFITGYGDLSLNNTMGSIASAYVSSNSSFSLVPSQGLSISCWFSCSGELNKIATIITLPLDTSGNQLTIGISGTNMIYSSYFYGG